MVSKVSTVIFFGLYALQAFGVLSSSLLIGIAALVAAVAIATGS